jgi:outer membrane protein assembly factor BamB
MRSSLVALAALMAVVVGCPAATAQQQSVRSDHVGAGRSGNFVVPALTSDKASALRLDRSFDARVSGHLYAQPLYWRAPGAHSAMLIVATQDDVVEAFDARTGKPVWRRAVGRPVSLSSLPCGNIDPLGITGTPVIDPAGQAVYFDAAVGRPNGPRHEVFGLSLKDGSVLQGWPVDVAAALAKTGRQFDPRTQNQRAALRLLDGTLYVAFGGHYGDCGDYHGWVVGLPVRDPGNVVSFRTRAQGGGIWAPGGLTVVGHDLFFATGNTFDAHSWSDGNAVFRLAPGLRRSGDPKDYFAPSNWKLLDDRDEDLGGSNPVALDVPSAGGDKALLLALGKDRKAYLLDRNNLGGIGGQLAGETVSALRIITAPAAYRVGNDVFVAFQAPGTHCPGSGRGGLTVLKITGSAPPRMSTAWCGVLRGRGSAIVTTTDGHSNPIVWILGAEGDNRLHAFRGDTGQPIFTSEPMPGLRRFQAPIATQDRLYVGADGRIYAFAY